MDKLYSMLGLAKKAGCLKSGEMGCMEAIKKKNAILLFIATDASDNTKKKFINLSDNYEIKYIIYGNKELLGKSIGKDLISVIAILDNNFAKSIKELLV